MTNKTTLALLLSLSSACGLIQVNGKPLGGGTGSTSPSTSTSSSAEPGESSDDHRNETREEFEARRQRTYEAEQKQLAADKAGRPAFCNEHEVPSSTDIDLDSFKDTVGDFGNWQRHVSSLAEAMCSTRKEHAADRPKVMAIRAQWMKEHGLDESDFAVVYLNSHGRMWDVQYFRDLQGPASQAAGMGYVDLDRFGAQASMLGKIAFVDACLPGSGTEPLLDRILCTTEPLDAAKAHAEIEGTKDLNPQTRYHLRQLVFTTLKKQAARKAAVATLAKEEPGVAKLVAIAEAHRKEWASPSPARAKLVALVESMEAAAEKNKRSAFAGCEAPTRAAWEPFVKAAELPAVAESGVVGTTVAAVFKTPEAYLAYRALELCAAGTDAHFSPQFDILGMSYSRRGPRSSVISAWMGAGDIQFDRKDMRIEEIIGRLGLGRGAELSDLSLGTISKVTPQGQWVEIAFKQDIIEREDCVAWRKTNRVVGINSNGDFRYESVCTKFGMVKVDRTPVDATISALVAEGLKPGMFLIVSNADHFPIIATANVKSTKAIWALGVAK